VHEGRIYKMNTQGEPVGEMVIVEEINITETVDLEATDNGGGQGPSAVV